MNKASEFLLANPEAGARVFLKIYPETAPRGASEADAVKSMLFAAKRRIPLYRPPYPNTKMGFIREDRSCKLDAKFLGLDIKDLKPIYTNDMIDEINNYDREQDHRAGEVVQDLTPSHSGGIARSASNPESSIDLRLYLDSGFAASRRPGMTNLQSRGMT